MDLPKTAPSGPGTASLTEGFGTPGDGSGDTPAELARLRARLVDVQRERDHLIAVVDILQEISGSLHFVDILQTISRKLGDAFALDRCAIFLTGENDEVRLVASYEDPNIRNLVVDVNRYPELKRVFASGETVFIPDAMTEPSLALVRLQLELRKVRSIAVVPLEWQGTIIGGIFVRTNRDARPFTEADVQFCAMVASLTAKALRNAHRFESLIKQQQHTASEQRTAELQRIALVGFLRRLLDRYSRVENQAFAEGLLPKASDEELERLVAVAMQVIEEEAKG